MNTRVTTHPMADGRPPRWATAWGEHRRYGVWAAFEVEDAAGKPVQQRMRWIYPGRFMMGSPLEDEEVWKDERPQHEVIIRNGFWLAETPCTQALWTAVMGTTSNPSRFKGEQRPVEKVSVRAVEAFLEKLGEQVKGLSPRLPYEAEWEYACRAGSETPRYRSWKTGEEAALDEIAWYDGNSDGQTHEVETKLSNEWGLHDMLGNVYEWCADSWCDYEFSSEPLVAELVPARRDAARVVRGGSWDYGVQSVRCACRLRYGPSSAWSDLGFRLARGQEPAES